MSITQEYHVSDNQVNTLVGLNSDLLHPMTETEGLRLARVRKSAKLTQAKLAKAVGCSTSMIGNIEAGIRGYGESVVTIARELKVTPEYLQLITDELTEMSPVPGYSVEALALAWLLDQVSDRLDKKKAEVAASAAILQYVNKTDEGPTDKLSGH